MAKQTDPKVGDVVNGKSGLRFTVTEVDRFVHYTLTTPGARGISAVPILCKCSKKHWRELAQGAM